ncbi:MAG: DUF1491 family protein [Methyloceanibacter sp.]|uniref:DUF1491 family protein n=1 Tax=Methyloceanibacter sp. TaxID=1965321 RepID=UPI003D9BACE3
MRVKSELWVRAYLRRCQSVGVPVVISHRGDADAGAIFVCVNQLNGTKLLYRPVPAGMAGTETERQWEAAFDAKAVSTEELDRYLVQAASFDSDVWIIELEDRAGRHFLGDDLAE